MSAVHGAQTNLNLYENGAQAIAAAIKRERNTTIVIGVDQDKGVLLIDIDTQADICRDAAEMQDHLRLIIEALNGHDPFAETEGDS
ncbi:hypothetical protein ACSBPH_01685 [Microbacterium sp. F51-2R]|uniref:hypothetical protein n=1 Tax=Microbacterium sp. F51-2R TaxID=3445777 RepID=UPI003FA164E3